MPLKYAARNVLMRSPSVVVSPQWTFPSNESFELLREDFRLLAGSDVLGGDEMGLKCESSEYWEE